MRVNYEEISSKYRKSKRKCPSCGKELGFEGFLSQNWEYEDDDEALSPAWDNSEFKIFCDECFFDVSDGDFPVAYSYDHFFEYSDDKRPYYLFEITPPNNKLYKTGGFKCECDYFHRMLLDSCAQDEKDPLIFYSNCPKCQKKCVFRELKLSNDHYKRANLLKKERRSYSRLEYIKTILDEVRIDELISILLKEDFFDRRYSKLIKEMIFDIIQKRKIKTLYYFILLDIFYDEEEIFSKHDLEELKFAIKKSEVLEELCVFASEHNNNESYHPFLKEVNWFISSMDL